MRAGGSFDIDAHNEDLNQIVEGNYASVSILKLPLAVRINQGGLSYFGGSLQSLTPTGSNPLVGQIPSTRFQLPQPANSISLVTQGIDEDGDFVSSYPFGDSYDNTGEFDNQFGNFVYGGGGLPSNGTQYAFGFMRLNGVGGWLQMSLLPLTLPLGPANYSGSDGTNSVIMCGWAGFSSVSGPISFFDWMGFCDALGSQQGPDGANQFILAAAMCNLNLGSNSQGSVNGGAIPNSSGRSPHTVRAEQKEKARNILVPRRKR